MSSIDEMHAAIAALPEPSVEETHLWHAVYCYRWAVLGFEHDGMHHQAEEAQMIYRQCVEQLAENHLPRYGAETTRLLLDWADVRAAAELADDLECERGNKTGIPSFLLGEAYAKRWRYERDSLLNDPP